jgi:hypothetical protein
MNGKLQHFFSGAIARLNDPASAGRVRPPRAAVAVSLKDIAREEFGEILKVLDDTDDFITLMQEKAGETPMVEINIYSMEKLPEKLNDQEPGTNGSRAQGDVIMRLEMLQPGNVEIRMTNCSILEDRPGGKGAGPKRTYRLEKPASFEEARQILGEALADMAPVSMGKICDSNPAQQAPGISIMRQMRLKVGP